jgi:hypothetical protein
MQAGSGGATTSRLPAYFVGSPRSGAKIIRRLLEKRKRSSRGRTLANTAASLRGASKRDWRASCQAELTLEEVSGVDWFITDLDPKLVLVPS